MLNIIILHLYIFRPMDDDSPDVAIIEDELNLEDLMKQKALLQARLGAYISDTEGDESRNNSVSKPLPVNPEPISKKSLQQIGIARVLKPDESIASTTSSVTTSKNNINKISKEKISNINDVILLDDSSDSPINTSVELARPARHSNDRERKTSSCRPTSPLLTKDISRNSREHRDHQSRQSQTDRNSRTNRSRSRSSSKKDRDRKSRDKRRHGEPEEDRGRQRHREHYDHNRQMEDLRQEINRDKLRERDVSRDTDRDRKVREDRVRQPERGGGNRVRGRDRDRDRDKWMRERSHSRSKAESDRKRERERERDRSGKDRNDRTDRDRDRYRGSLSEGQRAQQKDSSSDEDVNLDISIDDEDDEEKIIEMRRKQREELLKVSHNKLKRTV